MKVSDHLSAFGLPREMINTTLDLGRMEGRTLSIEKDEFILEVWPFKHTLQFRDVLLSVGATV
jgi:hypothetical protein